MKKYDPSTESSHLMYWDVSNLYALAVSQKLPVDGFQRRKDKFMFDEEFIQNYESDSDKGYMFEVDIKYPQKSLKLHSDLPFSPKRMKEDMCERLICILYDEKS